MVKRKKASMIIIIFLICAVAVIVCAALLLTRYYPLLYRDVIYESAEKYDLAPEFICAVIHTESKFKTEAVSEQGASGLMQITEDTAYWLAGIMEIEDFDYSNILDPGLNIRMGCYFLYRLDRQYGDMETALCAYNAGSGTVDSWLNEPEYSDDGKTLKSIPFQETRDFVKRISDSQRVYALLLRFS